MTIASGVGSQDAPTLPIGACGSSQFLALVRVCAHHLREARELSARGHDRSLSAEVRCAIRFYLDPARVYDRFHTREEEPIAVAFIQEFAISDRGTANYDAVNERLTKNQPAPEGLLIHFAGFDDEDRVFRIVNVWERREQGQAYLDEHVMPAVHAVLGDVEWPVPPTRQGFYELHHVAGI